MSLKLVPSDSIAGAAERTLREPALQRHLVVVDVRGLAFMDCAGVHAIVDASIRARKAGHRLVLVHARANVVRKFVLTSSSDDVEIGDLRPVATRSCGLLQVGADDPAA